MKFFTEVRTLDELKKLYHKLCRKYHPDMGGDVETMQKINNEYDEMIKYFATHGNKKEKEKASKEVPKKFREIIERLIHFADDETKGGRASRYSMNRIRDIYGSQFVDTVKTAMLTC